ncbi:MAG: hypothetical protein RLZZ467_130 [Gemmatimonadota bacterium]
MSQASTRDAGILLALLDRVDPEDAEQLNDLGVVLHRHGLTASAIEAFATAAVQDPSLRLARRNALLALTERDGAQPRLEAYRAQAASDPDVMAPALALARLAFARGDATELATALRDARRLGAVEPWCRWLEVSAAVEAGDLDAAERALAGQAGEESVALRWRAMVAYRRGELRAAGALVDAVVARRPSDPEAHLLRAYILGDLGETAAARQAYQAAVLLRPSLGRFDPHLALDGGRGALAPVAVATHVAHGVDIEVDGVPTGVANVAPTDADAMRRRGAARRAVGLAALAVGHTAVAERALEAAFATAPDVRGATALATIAMGRCDLASAFRWFDQLVAEHPEDATLWNARGVAAHRLGRWPEAESSYHTGLRWTPADAILLSNLGVVLVHQGRVADAVPLARQAAVAGSRAVRRNAAGILAAAGERSEARDLLGALLEDAQPSEEVSWLWYAYARVAHASEAPATAREATAREATAREAAARATVADPMCAAAWHLLAAIHEQRGDPVAAAIATDRGLAAAPVATTPGLVLLTHDGATMRGVV